VFSLRPLVDFWREQVSSSGNGWGPLTGEIEAGLTRSPELLEPIEDLSILKRHDGLIRTLMAAVFPPAFWDTEVAAAMVPFTLQPAFVSPPFQRLLVNEDGSFKGRWNVPWDAFAKGRLLKFFLLILKRCYGIEEDLDYPLIRIVTDPETGLERYFGFRPDMRFVQVRVNGDLPPLSERDRITIMENLTEPDVLRRFLPLERFEIQGFGVLRAMDVTLSEVLSGLERDLAEQGSIISQSGFARLQDRIRTLLGRPDVSIGVSAIQGDQVLVLATGCEMNSNCIFSESIHIPLEETVGSIFHRAAEQGEMLRIRDMLQGDYTHRIDQEVIQAGIRSVLVAPLLYQGQLIGAMKVGSPHPGDLGPREAMLTGEILPLFSMALKRSLDDLDKNIQAIIQERCTPVHPSVEWRFRQAVLNYLERTNKGEAAELEPIVFNKVNALYAASDIRGSSEARNQAVSADLTEHLRLALTVVQSAAEAKPMPIFHELGHQIRQRIETIGAGLLSGDDTSVINFIGSEVEPLFPLMKGYSAGTEEAIKAYAAQIDPNMRTVYRMRKEYEQSVSAFNERISRYLDREEAQAQSIFPHYFSKHQTDGLDYLIYVGESMVEKNVFNELYTRNLRLWQIIVACGIAWHTHQIKPQLKVPLSITHLILVNHNPLSVRFRFDEKRFDVDGVYDVAHEIVRSRIDKAMIRGSEERLTQPDRVALIYSRPDEAKEIRGHISFLQSEGMLLSDMESLELADMPGVQGLRAIRVGINLESPALARRAESLSL
jgi:hypothetical protein